MKYLYFKSVKGNFGDDLNPWLWSKLFNNCNGVEDDKYFLGIGSILHSGNKSINSIKQKQKIVFGTGIRPSATYKPFTIDHNWDIRFLRGPNSSRYLNNIHPFITDAAYALRHVEEYNEIKNVPKKYNISLMPYFHSMPFFDWKKICDDLGYHFISPYAENGIEYTLKEIAASNFIISEAMHGAILADVLRVPWHRFILTTPYTEGERISDFKWNDWLGSININRINSSFIPFYEKTNYHNRIRNLTGGFLSVNFFRKKRILDFILKDLNNIHDYSLSKTPVINAIDDKIFLEIEKLNMELQNQSP